MVQLKDIKQTIIVKNVILGLLAVSVPPIIVFIMPNVWGLMIAVAFGAIAYLFSINSTGIAKAFGDEFVEKLNMSDSGSAVLMDENGNVKEIKKFKDPESK